MAFHVRDPETDAEVRAFASLRGIGLTDAVKIAVKQARQVQEAEVQERIRRMREIAGQVAAWPDTGEKADKVFFDALSGDAD